MVRAQEIPKLLAPLIKISLENLAEKVRSATNAQIPKEIKEGDGTHCYYVILVVLGIFSILVILLAMIYGCRQLDKLYREGKMINQKGRQKAGMTGEEELVKTIPRKYKQSR